MIDFRRFVDQHRGVFEEIAKDPSLSPEEKKELEKAGISAEGSSNGV